MVVNKVLTYSAAQGECGQLGGHLARINSIREQVFLEDFLAQELELDGRWDSKTSREVSLIWEGCSYSAAGIY